MFSSNATQVSSANYIEDVFSTYLYTGNGSTQTITNGIDLSGKGGLVWMKARSGVYGTGFHTWIDTVRGVNKQLASNSSSSEFSYSNTLTAFNSTGFTLGADGSTEWVNANTAPMASWTFRKQPKFFDVLSYTGNGSNRTIAHNLGSIPGCIIIRRTDAAADWQVYHRSLANTEYMVLNSTAAKATGTTRWNSTTPTATEFSLGNDTTVNADTGTYVAYLFAHDAGGFGLTGTDNVISCGSYTGNGAAGGQLINLGYEAQWVMIKKTSSTGSWMMFDTMREWSVNGDYGSDKVLWANLSGAENDFIGGEPSSLGFTPIQDNVNQSGATYIYIAIRRGPMKVPTSGTSVFSPVVSSVDTGTITSGFPTDMVLSLDRTSGTSGFNRMVQDRLRGSFNILDTPVTAAETNNTSTASFDSNAGIVLNGGSVYGNGFVHEQFRRAPSFFDEVCYTGTGSATTFSHNLGVAPEMMIVKGRTNTFSWFVYQKDLTSANESYLTLNTDSSATSGSAVWNSTSPTSSVFSVGSANAINQSGNTYVAYLFATCAGVSKVGSYTGTGTTKQIDCGFAGGARFVLIKRTDSTGAWYVWDTARGIVSGNDPYLLLNSTAAETTGTDYIDTYSAGFEISSTAPAAINASGGTFIFLAIA